MSIRYKTRLLSGGGFCSDQPLRYFKSVTAGQESNNQESPTQKGDEAGCASVFQKNWADLTIALPNGWLRLSFLGRFAFRYDFLPDAETAPTVSSMLVLQVTPAHLR